MEHGWQVRKGMVPRGGRAKGWELLIPNPKLKLIDQVREVLRVKHYVNRAHLHRILQSYLADYHGSRTHLGLDKDAPEPRRVQPLDNGIIVDFSEVGGLHHRFERRAA